MIGKIRTAKEGAMRLCEQQACSTFFCADCAATQ